MWQRKLCRMQSWWTDITQCAVCDSAMWLCVSLYFNHWEQSHWSEPAPDLAQRGVLEEQDEAPKAQTCHSLLPSGTSQTHVMAAAAGLEIGGFRHILTNRETSCGAIPPTQISLGFVYWFYRYCCCCCLWPYKQQS